MAGSLVNVWRPWQFQGAGRRRGYFEGYYLKVVDPVHGLALAVIPGVSYDAAGHGEAFVQVLDGVAATARYHGFAAADFAWGDAARTGATRRGGDHVGAQGKTRFALRVGESRFRESGMSLRLPDLRAELRFGSLTPWPTTPLSPGAMGPFAFVPAMECRHGIVSLHHAVTGELTDGEAPATTLSPRAVGYVEKDWGRSFPRSWTWLQTNHLDGESEPCCLTVSAGRVPWLTGAFEGHIAGLLWRGRLLRFATYNGSRLRRERHAGRTVLRLRRGRYRLDVDVRHAPTASLASPTGGTMLGRVNESLTATADVRLRENGRDILATGARWVGFEVKDAD